MMRWCRLLPFTVIVASIFLTIKVGDLWQASRAQWQQTLGVSAAQAASRGQAEQEASVPAPPPPPAEDDAVASERAKEGGAEAPEAEAAGASGADVKSRGFTASEVEVLQKLALRREALERRAREVAQRESILMAAEQRIGSKLQEMQRLEDALKSLVSAYGEQQEAQLQSLVKIYENMKPKDAARIFQELEMDILLAVAQRMKERKLAPVLADLPVTRARDVTQELGRQRSLLEAGAVAAAPRAERP
jgi:flagellar motility protein MotE (MotC chaperone)